MKVINYIIYILSIVSFIGLIIISIIGNKTHPIIFYTIIALCCITLLLTAIYECVKYYNKSQTLHKNDINANVVFLAEVA
jgi:hypothetical protein